MEGVTKWTTSKVSLRASTTPRMRTTVMAGSHAATKTYFQRARRSRWPGLRRRLDVLVSLAGRISRLQLHDQHRSRGGERGHTGIGLHRHAHGDIPPAKHSRHSPDGEEHSNPLYAGSHLPYLGGKWSSFRVTSAASSYVRLVDDAAEPFVVGVVVAPDDVPANHAGLFFVAGVVGPVQREVAQRRKLRLYAV